MEPEDIAIAYKNALAPGQPFRFHCDQCGKCCKNREYNVPVELDQQ